MYGSGSRHSFSTSEKLKVPLKLDWEYKTGGGFLSQSGASWHRGMYIIPFAGGRITAFAETTGKEVWSQEFPDNRLVSRVAPAGDFIVAVTQSGKVAVLLAQSGKVQWTFDAGSEVSNPPMHTGGTGTVYIATDNGTIFKLTLRGLHPLAVANVKNQLSAEPILSTNGVCIATKDGRLTMFDRNLKELWSNKISGQAIGTIVSVKRNTICINKNGMLYSYDSATGKTSWLLNIGIDCTSGLVSDDYQVYAISIRGTVNAVNAAEGESNWIKRIDGDVIGRVTVSAGKLYIGTINKQIICLAASDGSQLWNERVDHETTCGLTASEKTLLVLPRVGTGYCMSLSYGQKIWSIETGGVGRIPPVSDGSKVCVGFSDGSIRMLDANNGQEIWNVILASSTSSPPALVGDKVIAGMSDENVFGLEAASGKTLWKTYVPYYVNSPPTVSGKFAFVGTWGGEIYSIDINTGRKQWSQPTNAEVKTTPSASSNSVYVGSWDSNIYSYDYQTGNLQWRMSTPYNLYQCISLGQDQGYIPAKEQIICIQLKDGSPLWFAKLDSTIIGEIAIDETSIVAMTVNGYLYRINSRGTKIWSRKIDVADSSRSLTIMGNYICITTGTQIKFYDIVTGRLSWQHEDNSVVSQPIFSNGRLYFTTDSGSIKCMVWDENSIINYSSTDPNMPNP
jgi:outer membrane protein assembly factor BamB